MENCWRDGWGGGQSQPRRFPRSGKYRHTHRGVSYDFWTDRRHTGPTGLTVAAPLDRIPIFVRGGAMVPTRQVVQYTDQAPINPLTFETYPDGASSREYYEDDGLSFDYQRGISLNQRVTAAADQGGVTITVSAPEGSYRPPARSLVFKVHAQRNQPHRVDIGGKAVAAVGSASALDSAGEGWAYDDVNNVVWVMAPDQGEALAARIEP